MYCTQKGGTNPSDPSHPADPKREDERVGFQSPRINPPQQLVEKYPELRDLR
jgi:hypothetical protein